MKSGQLFRNVPKFDQKIRNPCQIFGFIEAPIEESIIIFHACSSNLNVKWPDSWGCGELHIGNTPRSIMTKVTSTRRKNRLPGSLYGNCDLGDQDKLMITYNRDQTHDYTMYESCGVIYQGNMHFFGGSFYFRGEDFYSFDRQHFIIETNRSGKMVKITKMKDLDQSSVDIAQTTFSFANFVPVERFSYL